MCLLADSIKTISLKGINAYAREELDYDQELRLMRSAVGAAIASMVKEAFTPVEVVKTLKALFRHVATLNYLVPNHPPRNPARRKPFTMCGHCLINRQVRPER